MRTRVAPSIEPDIKQRSRLFTWSSSYLSPSLACAQCSHIGHYGHQSWQRLHLVRLVADESNDHAVEVEEEHKQVETKLHEW